jgi:ubiquinone/menaquinone biosynthesis C-methylase UbiE
MDKYYEKKYHELEEENWWFVSRRDIILKLIKNEGIKPTEKILEIGCSGGPLIKLLTEEGYTNISGIDISQEAIDQCVAKGIDNVKVIDASKTLFGNNEFDLLIASDILEHIKEDKSTLFDWIRVLKPNGTFIIFVPAFNFLWSEHDRVNKHYRRYDRVSLNKLLEETGFIVKRVSYWNFLVFIPTYLVRTFERFLLKQDIKSKDQLYKLNPILNGLLIILLKFENILLKYNNLPFGVSIFAVCKK